jgi:phage shock protein C
MARDNVLVRPQEGRYLAGVCMGVANYTGLDVLLVRIMWLIFFHVGFILYLLLWFFIPSEV